MRTLLSRLIWLLLKIACASVVLTMPAQTSSAHTSMDVDDTVTPRPEPTDMEQERHYGVAFPVPDAGELGARNRRFIIESWTSVPGHRVPKLAELERTVTVMETTGGWRWRVQVSELAFMRYWRRVAHRKSNRFFRNNVEDLHAWCRATLAKSCPASMQADIVFIAPGTKLHVMHRFEANTNEIRLRYYFHFDPRKADDLQYRRTWLTLDMAVFMHEVSHVIRYLQFNRHSANGTELADNDYSDEVLAQVFQLGSFAFAVQCNANEATLEIAVPQEALELFPNRGQGGNSLPLGDHSLPVYHRTASNPRGRPPADLLVFYHLLHATGLHLGSVDIQGYAHANLLAKDDAVQRILRFSKWLFSHPHDFTRGYLSMAEWAQLEREPLTDSPPCVKEIR